MGDAKSYAERLFDFPFIGALAPEAARIAIVKPAADQQVTFDEEFDGFPMFSPDGTRLVWASNRGAREMGETNVFIAEWRE